MTAPQPRPGILDINPYVPGKSTFGGRVVATKLSANESALGPSPTAIAAYERASGDLYRYPDGSSADLRAALADRHGLDADRIVCGAGSDELLYNLARAYAGPGDEVLYSVHGFNIYPIAALCVGASPVTAPETNLTVDVGALLRRVTDKTKIVFIANPNNPTGSYISIEEMSRLRRGLPAATLLVIDSAYAEYVLRNDYSPGIDLVDAGENTVMTRTFSKIYGLAALRIGWAYCPLTVADVLNRVRGPFNLSTAAQSAGEAALGDVAHVAASRDHNSVWLPWLSDRLAALGLAVMPSVANFILVRFPDDKRRNASSAMAHFAENGVVPRETGGYGLSNFLRISIGREDEVKAAAEIAADFMNK
ncbi:histidinol-phosphate transaminase [Alphaproteobacteria bacterium]|nr:histidinol-phosphate transaminase [Alphaproteobacteria bacterium]